MSNQRAVARELGRYAMRKIGSLQRSYCGGDGTTSARARLAQLRRLNTNVGASILTNGAELFDGWPEERLGELGASRQDEERATETITAILGLYALHQQSVAQGCAVVKGDAESDESYRARLKRGSFGRACRAIDQDLDEATGVQRRLMSIEGATNFEGVLNGVRGLVRLMKSSQRQRSRNVGDESPASRTGGSSPIALDYGRLTEELYLMQVSESLKSSVLRQWARDYYAYIPTEQ